MAVQADVDAITARVQGLETKVDGYTGPVTAPDLDLTALDKAVSDLEGSVNAKLS